MCGNELHICKMLKIFYLCCIINSHAQRNKTEKYEIKYKLKCIYGFTGIFVYLMTMYEGLNYKVE